MKDTPELLKQQPEEHLDVYESPADSAGDSMLLTAELEGDACPSEDIQTEPSLGPSPCGTEPAEPASCAPEAPAESEPCGTGTSEPDSAAPSPAPPLRRLWHWFLTRADWREGASDRQMLGWAVVVTLVACVGFTGASLFLAAAGKGGTARLTYLTHPGIFLLNLLPVVLLAALVWLLTGRARVGFCVSGGVTLGLSMVNAVKIALRNDPFYLSDLLLIMEAGKMSGRYDLTPARWQVVILLLAILGGVVCARMTRFRFSRWSRARAGALAAVVLTGGAAFRGLYLNDELYDSIHNFEWYNQWSEVENFQSRGFLYPFLHTASELFPTPPDGYDEDAAADALAAYSDADIPEEQKVNLILVQLEAFCDLTDYLDLEGVERAYAEFHALEEESLTGDLLTNIFAGGTVDSERSVITGYTRLPALRQFTNSYVWYFQSQGYNTQGAHPGYDWFYNRLNVNDYLGFQQYFFVDDFDGRVDVNVAPWRSDEALFHDLYDRFVENRQTGKPLFDLTVTYQNHGPYDPTVSTGGDYVSEAGWSDAATNILNNYLCTIEDTAQQLCWLVDQLRQEDAPVILVAFGDHKPWLGDDGAVYDEVGININTSWQGGFEAYYSTPYLIWANDAAKDALDQEFVGQGETISPCFLMRELFDLCGWDGSALMQAQRALIPEFNMVSSNGGYEVNGRLTNTLDEEKASRMALYRQLEFYVQEHFDTEVLKGG